MDEKLIKPGDHLTFQPWSITEGWSVERRRSLTFKYRDLSPQDFRGKEVIVIGLAVKDNSFRVHFAEDLPCDYFYCLPEMLEPMDICRCSSYDLFNFGCKCGTSKI